MTKVWACALILVAAQAQADPLVMETLAADLDEDGRKELAVLVGESDISLAIFGQTEDYGPMRLVAEGPGLAWMGSLNEPPRMEITEAGSLRVTSSNWGIGRNKWEMDVIVAWRSGAFRVAGIRFVEVDTLELESGRSCDVNLLTGRGILTSNREDAPDIAVRAVIGAVPIEDWPENGIAQACGPDL